MKSGNFTREIAHLRRLNKKCAASPNLANFCSFN